MMRPNTNYADYQENQNEVEKVERTELFECRRIIYDETNGGYVSIVSRGKRQK